MEVLAMKRQDYIILEDGSISLTDYVDVKELDPTQFLAVDTTDFIKILNMDDKTLTELSSKLTGKRVIYNLGYRVVDSDGNKLTMMVKSDIVEGLTEEEINKEYGRVSKEIDNLCYKKASPLTDYVIVGELQ